MTARELIAALEKIPPDTEIRFFGYHDEYYIVTDVVYFPGENTADIEGDCPCSGCIERRAEDARMGIRRVQE